MTGVVPAPRAAGRPEVRPAGNPLLEASGLSKDFGGLRALSSVSFALGDGEFAGVIGPNGAGKTTLFSILCGFMPPSGGEVRFGGLPTAGMRPDRLCHLGMARTFQLARPFAEMTVFENVLAAAVFGKRERAHPARDRDDALEILEGAGLAAVARRAAGSLALAQRKKLELARALATRPKLLMLDEALAGLNPREIDDAIPFVRSLNADRGIAIMMIEHNLRAVMGLSKRLLVLDFGRLIFDGPPEDAAEDPGVVRAYLGEDDDAPR